MVNPFCTDETLTPTEKWHKIYGTDNVGNLSEYKVNQHVGHCFAPCPYSTQSAELRTRHMLGIALTDPIIDRVDHTGSDGKVYYMKTSRKGEWGYVCTYSGCSYLLDHGIPYFYK